MYRAVTWAVLDRQIDPANQDEVSQLSEKILIEVSPARPADEYHCRVLVDGQDVTRSIREPEVEVFVSLVASYPRVRRALTNQQRRIAAAGSIVMVGRDIGTVVLPDADLKIFMQASAEERARRRYGEGMGKNEQANYDEILQAIAVRDKQDRENPVSPTVPAHDAMLVNTDGLSIEEVFHHLRQLVTDYPNGN